MESNYSSNFVQEQPHDVIQLPSGGKFYSNKKSTLKVAYLTASDENTLTSPNLIQSGKVLEVLLKNKILDKDISPENLLSGDRNAVLFFLRSTGYGADYTVTLNDPKNGSAFEHTFNLDDVKAKEISIEPDEKSEIAFHLPNSKKNVKFRYLTQGEEDKIIRDDEARRKKMGKDAVSEVMTKRLAAQIMEVDGVRDRGQIQVFVNNMPVMDSMKLRKYISSNEPGLDLDFDVEAPSGETFRTELPITPGFLWPYIEL
jgi:hypothetical protein